MILASLATLLAVLLSALEARVDPVVAYVRTQTVVTPPGTNDIGSETSRVEERAASAPAKVVEALAGIVAKRYRISQEATREFIGTAFREGGLNGVDPLLIIAVMAVESRFNPIAESDGGAMGLMQVIPRYHADQLSATGGESVLDPQTNIRLGVRVLREYIRRGGTELAGLQLYNGAPDDESNTYANKVLGEKQRLQEAVRRTSYRERGAPQRSA